MDLKPIDSCLCPLSPFFVLEVSTCGCRITHGPAGSVFPHVLLTRVASEAPSVLPETDSCLVPQAARRALNAVFEKDSLK